MDLLERIMTSIAAGGDYPRQLRLHASPDIEPGEYAIEIVDSITGASEIVMILVEIDSYGTIIINIIG